MTAATGVQAQPGITRPGIARLTLVEIRKLADTRSGRWLLGLTAGLCLLIAAVGLAAPDEGDRAFPALFTYTLFPVGLILPVLGILSVTGEWSQRTALTTFALVPRRSRVVVAKLLSGLAWALASLLLSLAAAAAGNLAGAALGRTDGDWGLTWRALGFAAVFQVVNVVMGVAFGLLLLSSPLAIVLYFVLPVLWTTMVALVGRFRGVTRWVDLNAQLEPLAGSAAVPGAMTGQDWARLAVAVSVWVLLPMVAGAVRVTRTDVR